MRFGTPFWEEDGRIISWGTVLKIPDTAVSSPTILPLGVFIKLDLTGRNWEDWKATGYYSLGKFYNSTEEFRAAIFSPSYEMPAQSVDGNWTSTDQNGDALPLDDLPPPTSVAQGSPRFKLDTNEDYVSWMDFSFYFAVSEDIGLSLFDIQYKGKRLMYELSLQDAITHYAGSDPFASETTFFDTETGMGASMIPLIRGYDCPTHATYLNTTFSSGNTTLTHADSICIFEYDAGFPIRRHTVYPAYTSVAKNIVFTIRTVATVANYDFLIEYSFFYDGAIEVSARASGYISAAYWEGAEDYGFHIHDVLSGALHDHVMTFKADLDVLGTKNSVQKVELVPVSAE
jgi:primary-amine oxidase